MLFSSMSKENIISLGLGGDFAGLYSCKKNAKNKNVMLIFIASITTLKKKICGSSLIVRDCLHKF